MLEALELYDSISIIYSAESYTFGIYVREKRNICECRSVSVRVNANSGEVESFRINCPEGYTDCEPDYVPKITLEKAQEIIIKHGHEKGLDVRFDSIQVPEVVYFFKVLYLCMKPKFAESKIKSNAKGWVWDAFIKRRPGHLVFETFQIYIDSETGEILYSDL